MRDTMFVALVVAFGMLAAAVGVAFAVPASPVFELEGDTADNPAGTRQDWDNVYRSVTGLGSASPSTALVQTFVGDWAEPDLKTFGMSNKDEQPASAWQCNTDNNPQAKTNILHAYAALYAVDGDLHVYLGSDRESNNGDANFGFWLFQKPVNCVPSGASGTGTFTGTKTHGDLFVVSEYTSGGKVAATKVYVWTDPTPDAPESGDECLGNGIDCSAANAGEDHPLAAGADCTSPEAQAINPHVCGTVNGSTIDAAWRQGLAARELFESGINLSKLAPGRCFGMFLAETRSSQEFEADLKDFVTGELDTCAQITVRKATLGGDGTFPFTVTGGGLTPASFSLAKDGERTFTQVMAGTYTIAEEPQAGWQLTDIQCQTSGGDTGVTKDLAAGSITVTTGLAGTVDCTFTNTRKATLTVIKQVENMHGGTRTAGEFTLRVDGEAVASGTARVVAPGAHVVSEDTPPAGYVKVGIGGDCDASGNVTLAAGQAKTCTVTNRDVAPRLTVVKQVVNDNGGTKTPAQFTMHVTGADVSQASFPGSAAGVTVTLTAGAYSVDETADAGYAKALGADCAGTIAVGESKTCTIVNDDLPARLTVVKQVVNDDGGSKTPADFTMQVAGTAVSPPSFPGSAAGVTVTLAPGSFSVTETGPAGYTQTSAVGCSGTIALGESRTCTLVNDDVAPRLTVVKQVVNDNGGARTPADFTMQVAGTAVSSPSFPGSATGVTVTLAPGSFSVTETGPAGYAQVSAVGCSGTIALGESRTCTLVNDDAATRLIVIKQVVNQHGGARAPADFTMQVTGTGAAPASFPGSAAGVTVSLQPGAFSVSESSHPGYAQLSAEGCHGTIAAGETRTCTLVNGDVAPRLTVVKHVVNGAGSRAVAGDFTMLVTGTGVSQPSFPGSETGTTVTLKAGDYGVDEIAAPGYQKTLSAGCAGVIGVGEERTCTVTNSAVTLVADFPFCDDHGVQAVMNPFTGRFPDNLGPDVVVDGSAASIQAALDGATDVNGDGYILIGLVANGEAPFGLSVGGGKITQNFKISRAYGKPFGLIGCQVVVRDPHACDGVAPAIITAGATSPEHPVGSGARLFVYGVSAEGSESAPAWVVRGEGRHLEQVGAAYSVVGFRVVGNRNVLTDVTVTGAWADGVVVDGNNNVVEGAVVMSGAGDGVVINGHRNHVRGSAIGEQGKSNLGVGLTVEGRANRVAHNVVHANGGDGIRIGGGTAANPNVVRANTVGAPYRGNGGHGIVVDGTGGGAAPVEIEANVVHSNFGVGVKVEGTGHQLKANRSGGAGLNANGGCEYDVAAGNWNAGGNKSNGTAITGSIGTPFPTGCR